jgi:hypothetical protein
MNSFQWEDSHQMTTIISINFGNENCLIVLACRGSVENISNPSCEPMRSTLLAFQSNDLDGIFAQFSQIQNIQNIVTIWRLLIIVCFNCERQQLQTLCSFGIFSSKHVVLKCVIKMRESHSALNNESHFSWKVCLTLHNAVASFLDSATGAGIKGTVLRNSTTALTINYSM